MRAFTLVLGSLLSLGALADTNNAQDNTSISSPSSTMSNVQVNPVGDVAESSYGGGIRCSEPTLNTGVTQTRTGFGDDMTTGYVNFAIPLGPAFNANLCDDAAKTQTNINKHRLLEMQDAALRQDEYHQAKMEQEWLKVAKAEAGMAKICMEMHKYMSGNPNTEVWALCAKFAPITKDHHKGHAEINTALIPDTHERISPNKQDRP